MKTFIKISLLAVILSGCSFAMPSYAQDSTEYELLEPLPFVSQSESGVDCVTEDGDPCATANTFIPGIIRLVIAISGALAVIKIIFGGITYMSSDAISGKNEGKQHINDALLGLGLVICSWLILYSLNPRLVEFDFSIDGTRAGSAFDTNLGTSTPEGIGYGPSFGKPWPSSGGSDITERNSLKALGIDVKEPTCTTIGQSGCTSVAGISPRIGPALAQLERACGTGCVVTITGGTEYWLHGTKKVELLENTRTMHRAGGNAVDIRKLSGSRLDVFIMAQPKVSGSGCSSLGPGGMAYRHNGALYVDEGSHWHVCIP